MFIKIDMNIKNNSLIYSSDIKKEDLSFRIAKLIQSLPEEKIKKFDNISIENKKNFFLDILFSEDYNVEDIYTDMSSDLVYATLGKLLSEAP